MCRWQVKLCDPLVTHESYLSALEMQYTMKRYTNSRYFTLLSDDDTTMVIDCDSRTREEIHHHVKQVVGKTE